MRIKQLLDEDFVNYKKASMFIGTISCGGKCCTEANIPFTVCQNDELRRAPILDIPDSKLVERYINNILTSAIVIGGLEPFEQFDELKDFIHTLRIDYNIFDDVVIYTGYREDEIKNKLEVLKKYSNIVIKFGRYIPNAKATYDDVLGIYLASDNQYGERIS